MNSEVAKTYAEALYSLALDSNNVAKYKEDVKLVEASLDEVGGIRKFLIAAKVSKDEKKQLFKDAFEGKISEDVLNFMYVLVDRGRISGFKDIFHDFYHFANESLGVKEGIIETARPLDAAKLAELEKALGKDGVKVELKNKINTTLISGFRVIFDDKIIDTSMKKKINQMNEMLLRKDVSLWN